jgi:hypothetical protein
MAGDPTWGFSFSDDGLLVIPTTKSKSAYISNSLKRFQQAPAHDEQKECNGQGLWMQKDRWSPLSKPAVAAHYAGARYHSSIFIT